jgi:ABC-2 type transport system permease protein
MNGRMREVFWYELRRNIRRKGYLFTTFGVPILALLASLVLPGLFASLGAEAPQQNNDPTQIELPTELMQGIDQAGYIDETGRIGAPQGDLAAAFRRFDDEAAAQAALDAGTIQTYYVIAADYFETGDVSQILPRLSITQINPDLIEQLLLDTLGEGVDPQVFTRLGDPATFTEIDRQRNTEGESESAFDSRFVVVYVFAIILLGSLFTTNGYLLQSVIEEKETRLIEILLASLRPFELLAGKIAAMGILGLLQVIVWTSAFLFFGWLSLSDQMRALLPMLTGFVRITIPFNILPILFVYFVLGYLLFAALFGVVGALSNSMREGPQYTVIFVLPAVAPFYFLSIFATTPNSPLAVFLSVFPLTAPISMAMRLAVTDVPLLEVALSVGLLALSVVGVMWLAGRLFRVGTLLAGQMPKLRDIPALLRG